MSTTAVIVAVFHKIASFSGICSSDSSSMLSLRTPSQTHNESSFPILGPVFKTFSDDRYVFQIFLNISLVYRKLRSHDFLRFS